MTWVVVGITVACLFGVAALYIWRRRTGRTLFGGPTIIPEPEQYAIVLAHGLLGFDHLKLLGTKQHYFRGIAGYLRSQGVGVYTTKVKPLGTVPERAFALAQRIEELDEKRIVVVAHSMGGLDARYALAKFDLALKVHGLITVGTPHHGSCLANVASFMPARVLRLLLGQIGMTTDALEWLGEKPAKQFNQQILNHKDVFYGSVVGETSRMAVMANPLLLATFEILQRLRGSNDAMVPASSQRWGRLIQTIPAHHFGQIGWSPMFDACGMYLRLLGDLHSCGLQCLPSKTVPKALGGPR